MKRSALTPAALLLGSALLRGTDRNAENPSRIKAERVVHGGTNDLKEFPS